MEERDQVIDKAIKGSFDFLKHTTTYQAAMIKAIPLAEEAGTLLPLGYLHCDDQKTIALMAQWRKQVEPFFGGRFPITQEGTAKWLKEKVLDIPQRILFLVLDRLGRPVGHLGWANGLGLPGALEVDNVVRGEQADNPGIMATAMRALLKWGQDEFSPSRIYLRVLSDNTHAIQFYQKLGFTETERIPLRKSGNGEVWNLLPRASGDKKAPDAEFVLMDLRPEAWKGKEIILTAGPSVSSREMYYTFDAASNGWNHHMSDYLDRFENAVSKHCGRKHALPTSSCTGALHMSLLACGVGPGDEVIVPDMTWVATANAAMYCGATPVFADIDPVDWCMSPDSFRKAITPKTKVVMPVYLYGHYPRLDEIRKIAGEHGIRVVEDVAPGLGAWRGDKPAGSEGDFSCFSFQGAKLAVMGEGGMILTDDEELYTRVRSIWDQGRKAGTFYIELLGWKYKMSNLQAAFGLGQVERIGQMVEAKRRIFSWYEEGLRGVKYISFQRERPGTRGIYWMSSFSLDASCPLTRDQFRNEMKAVNVDTRPTFPSISQFEYWPKRQSPQPVAARVAAGGINLPSGVCLRKEQVDYVCGQIRRILA